MFGPLAVLRQYNMQKKEIITSGDKFIFGNFSWKKHVKTNFIIHGTRNKTDQPKDYYTLESLVYFIKYSLIKHIVYMRQATYDKIQVVKQEDRRSLLNYLYGHINICKSIDETAVAALPTRLKNYSCKIPMKKPEVDKSKKKILYKQKSLTDVMSKEQIAAIREKYLLKKQSRNKGYLRVKKMNGRF